MGRLVWRHPLFSLTAAALLALAGTGLAVNRWADYHHDAARQAVAAARYPDALAHARACLRVRPSSAEAHLLVARVERLTGNFPEAEHHLNECVRLQQGASEATQLEWVLLRAQGGEVDVVAPGLLACVEQGHPETPRILETLAWAYIREMRFRPALACLNRLLARGPDTAHVLDWRGLVHERLGARELALRDYQRALELDPDRSEVRLRLALILLEHANPPEALPHLERLHRAQPDRPEVLVGLARCRFLQGEVDEARRLFDAVLAAHPDHTAALVQRGKLELVTDHAALAEALVRRALQADPADLESHYTLYRSLQQQPGRELEADVELARYNALKADIERLAVLLQEEVDLAVDPAAVASEIGALFLRLGQPEAAQHWLQDALKRDPRHQRAHELLAEYFEQSNHPDQAAEHRRAAAEAAGP